MPRLLIFLILACTISPAFASDPSRPNIILFIADDISWNDFGCYDQPSARTPNIDQLAAAGLRFDNAILTASSCSPSKPVQCTWSALMND